MSGGAHVGSIDAVRDFRAALHTFLEEGRGAVGSYDMELNRTPDWLLEGQPRYWQQEVRRCQETIVQAKIELERCRSSKLPGGGAPSCMEEIKAVERARQRHRLAEEKVDAVRKWGHAAQRETAEYTGRANQLGDMFDADVPRAIAFLDRALDRLESYLLSNHPGDTPPSTTDVEGETESVARPIDLLSQGAPTGERPIVETKGEGQPLDPDPKRSTTP